MIKRRKGGREGRKDGREGGREGGRKQGREGRGREDCQLIMCTCSLCIHM